MTSTRRTPGRSAGSPTTRQRRRSYGRYIVKNLPSAKIGIIYQNDSYGKDYIEGLESGLGSHKSQIVSQQGFQVTDTSLANQVIALRRAGVDTLMIFGTPTPTIITYATMAAIGWKPANIFVNSVSATDYFMGVAVAKASAAEVNGSISTYYTKDPANPSLGQRQRHEAVQGDHGQVRAGRRTGDGRALRLRDGEGVHVRPGAEGGRGRTRRARA